MKKKQTKAERICKYKQHEEACIKAYYNPPVIFEKVRKHLVKTYKTVSFCNSYYDTGNGFEKPVYPSRFFKGFPLINFNTGEGILAVSVAIDKQIGKMVVFANIYSERKGEIKKLILALIDAIIKLNFPSQDVNCKIFSNGIQIEKREINFNKMKYLREILDLHGRKSLYYVKIPIAFYIGMKIVKKGLTISYVK